MVCFKVDRHCHNTLRIHLTGIIWTNYQQTLEKGFHSCCEMTVKTMKYVCVCTVCTDVFYILGLICFFRNRVIIINYLTIHYLN